MEVLNMATRFMPIETGKHTVTAAQATAKKVEITLPRTCTGAIINVYTSAGIQQVSAKVTFSSAKLVVEDNSTAFQLAENMVIHYICF
jgi:hypothetical protein